MKLQELITLSERMPASIIKHKQKLANMTDQELADRFKDFDETRLRQMAWRHGYGKMSPYYWDRVQKGKSVSEAKKPKPTDSSKWSYYKSQAKKSLMFILLLMPMHGRLKCIKKPAAVGE